AKAQAESDVVRFNNKAELAGVAARVAAFDGDGSALAQNILLGKIAPSYQTILSNSEGPLMDLFRQFTQDAPGARPPAPPVTHREDPTAALPRLTEPSPRPHDAEEARP